MAEQLFNLSKLIDDYMAEANEEKGKRIKEWYKEKGIDYKFYPSQVHKCSRNIVYNMLDYPSDPLPPRVLRIMDNGTSMHDRFEELFGEMGILVADELPITNEDLYIRGRTDALIRVDDDLALVELKSANDRQFSYMKKQGEPAEKYVMQLQLYMHLTGIHKGIILIENKNDQSLLEFWIDYDEVMAEEIVNKIEHVIEHVKKEEIPPREKAKTSFDCRYCDYRDICWE